jgi:hypothetical protein
LNPLAIAAVIAGFFSAIALLYQDWREREKEKLRMGKLRGSHLYRELYLLVVNCRAQYVDQVRVERNRILFTSASPPGLICSFSPQEKGYRPLSGTNTRVLAEVIGEDMDILLDNSKYRFTRYKIIRANGSMDYGYLYTIRSAYKDELLAKPMYTGLRIM